jgi:hypothetical protein
MWPTQPIPSSASGVSSSAKDSSKRPGPAPSPRRLEPPSPPRAGLRASVPQPHRVSVGLANPVARRQRVEPSRCFCIVILSLRPRITVKRADSVAIRHAIGPDPIGARQRVGHEGSVVLNPSSRLAGSAGCVATGMSLEDVEREMRAAIARHLGRSSVTAGRFRQPRAPVCTSSANRGQPRSSLLDPVRFVRFASRSVNTETQMSATALHLVGLHDAVYVAPRHARRCL